MVQVSYQYLVTSKAEKHVADASWSERGLVCLQLLL